YEIIYVFIGVLGGAGLLWLLRGMFGRRDGEAAENDIKKLQAELHQAISESATVGERARMLTQQLESEKNETRELQNLNNQLVTEVSALKERNEALRERLENQQKEIQANQEQLKNQFQVLAGEILEEKSKKFTEQNKVSLGLLLEPLGQKI